MRKFALLLTLVSLTSTVLLHSAETEKVSFNEIWGYVLDGYESSFDSDKMAITDLCYFSADVNCYGEFFSFPDPIRLKGYTGRKHLVVTCEGRSLSHFSLDPSYGVSKKIIKSIVKASDGFEGVQIDFENVPARDAENFRKFLRDLRKALGKKKMLTLCVPARNKLIKDDIYEYTTLVPLVDRIFIMAYDQHYAGSAPGSVAEIPWVERVTEYAKTVIPEEKLVVGMPFYGRSWVNENFAKAWLHSGIERIVKENKVKITRDKNNIPNFKFKKEIQVTGWYDDEISLLQRMKEFKKMNVNKIGFWRVGQEDPAFWNHLEASE